MIGKIIVHGDNRDQALARMRTALGTNVGKLIRELIIQKSNRA